jgi:uncharacterized protein YceK
MKRASLAAALTLVILILGGCGTIANFGGKGWENTRIYGGVLTDVKSAENWIAYRPISKESEIQRDVGTVVGTGLIALDVPLSAIGDTLTLPITIPAAIWGTPAADTNVSRKETATASKPKSPPPAPDAKKAK